VAESDGELNETVQACEVCGDDADFVERCSEHFDIALSKRALAVRLGAKQITLRALAQKISDRRVK
jgi:hypothetical protein